MIGIKIYLNRYYYLTNLNQNIINSSGSDYYNWSKHEEVVEYNSHGLFPKSQKEIDSFFDDVENKKILCMAIMHKEDNQNTHIGNVSLQNFNWINRSAELAIIIGDPFSFGKGIGKMSCRAMVKHGFEKLNLHRIHGGTVETNFGMQKIFEGIGFDKEAEFKGAVFLNGKYQRIFHYGLIRN